MDSTLLRLILLFFALASSAMASPKYVMYSTPRLSQQVGQPVVFTPTGDPTVGREFRYSLISPGDTVAQVARDWSADPNWTWDTTGLVAGTYRLSLRSRDVTGAGGSDTVSNKQYELVAGLPIISIAVDAFPVDSSYVDAMVGVSATLEAASGSVAPEYRFWLKGPQAPGNMLVQNWGSGYFFWDTKNYASGQYQIIVEARNAQNASGVVEASKQVTYTLKAFPDALRLNRVEIGSDRVPSPQPVGVKVPFSAKAFLNSTPTDWIDQMLGYSNIEYRFFMRPVNSTQLALVQDWSQNTSWQWNSSGFAPGIYIFKVQARNTGTMCQASTCAIESDLVGFRIEAANLAFWDTTIEAHVTHKGESWGGAWGDVNNDGYTDLWVTNHRDAPTLYENKGDGTFTNATYFRLATTARTDSHGTAWADFDNDGDQDLIQTAGGGQGVRDTLPGHFNFLYVNDNGVLTNEGTARNVSYEIARGRGATWLDWNNDGLLDVFFTAQGGHNDPPNALFVQKTDGTFYDASGDMNVNPSDGGNFAVQSGHASSETSTLFVGSSVFPKDIYPGVQGAIPVSTSFSVSSVTDIAVADFDNDLRPDVYVAVASFETQLYEVKPGQLDLLLGAFTPDVEVGLNFEAATEVVFDLTAAAQTADGVYIGSQGLQPEDFPHVYKNSSKSDFTVTLRSDDPRVHGMMSYSANPHGIYIGYDPVSAKWTITVHNTEDLAYSTFFGRVTSSSLNNVTEINFSPPVLHPRDSIFWGDPSNVMSWRSNQEFTLTPSQSVVAGDFDNDMDVDLYVLKSTRIANTPNELYLNSGNGSFVLVENAAGAGGTLQGSGDTALVADYDRDGFLDIITFNGRAEPPFNDGPTQLFRNLGNGNHWLLIDLKGTVSNADGIGARVYLHTPDGKVQLREQNGGVHNKGQNDKRIHFGLGPNTSGNLVIEWPSGIQQTVSAVAADQLLKVVEPSS